MKYNILFLAITLFCSSSAMVLIDPCVLDPTTPNCANYKYPNASINADINKLCGMMDNMPGCSVNRTCMNPTYSSSEYCINFSILEILCKDMPGMNGCGNYTKMCKNGSVVTQCQTAYLPVPTTMTAQNYINSICEGMPNMSPCKKCKDEGDACDLLNTYSQLCLMHSGMEDCKSWSDYCQLIPAWDWCKKSTPPTAPTPTPIAVPPIPPAATPDCITEPSQPKCADYVYPASMVDANIRKLCDSMPNMVGCEINATICSTPKFSNNKYCNHFVLWKELCIDMPMNGCGDYKSMCTTNSKVPQCALPVLPLPSTMTTENSVKSMCSDDSMHMTGCDKCAGGKLGTCDVFLVYSDLCNQMPNMKECRAWQDLCEFVPDWPICPASIDSPPEMRMYFHVGIKDYILFQGWVPKDYGGYVSSWLAIFCFGIIYELLKYVRVKAEKKWTEKMNIIKSDYESDNLVSVNGSGDNSKLLKPEWDSEKPPFVFSIDFPRSLLQALEVTWSLMLMLVAMTFNVGLFLAVPAGAFAGTMIVGRFLGYKPAACCN